MNYAALHFPDFTLNCQLSHKNISQEKPAALISDTDSQKPKLLIVNSAARALGIAPGMLSTNGFARCSDLLLFTPEREIIQTTQKAILAFAETLSPDFEHTTSDTVLIDLNTLLVDCMVQWEENVRASSAHLGLPLSIGVGPTPDLAHLAAFERDSQSFPIQSLIQKPGFALDQIHVLSLWGIKTLGDLANLPRQGLAERLGADLAHLHDILHKKVHRPLRLHHPVTRFMAEHIFEPPITNYEPIVFIARRLLKSLCNRLRHHQRAAAELHFTLSYEDESAHFRKLKMTEPTSDEDSILAQLHTHLENLKASACICEFHLKIVPTLPLSSQHKLFERGLKDPNQFQDTQRRIASIVGLQNIGIPRVLDQHKPDSFSLHPYEPNCKTTKVPELPRPTLLPLCRRRPPLLVKIVAEKDGDFLRPLALLTGPHQGPVKQARGPFPLSGNWWERSWRQAQWDIEMDNSLLLQLIHSPPDRWELTGTYG